MKVVDYSKLPDRSYQLRWLRSYLENYLDFQGRGANKVSNEDVEKLYDQVNKFILVRPSAMDLPHNCKVEAVSSIHYRQFVVASYFNWIYIVVVNSCCQCRASVWVAATSLLWQ